MVKSLLAEHLRVHASASLWDSTQAKLIELYRAGKECICLKGQVITGFLKDKYFVINYCPKSVLDIQEWASKKSISRPAPAGAVIVDKLIAETVRRLETIEGCEEIVEYLKNYREHVQNLKQRSLESYKKNHLAGQTKSHTMTSEEQERIRTHTAQNEMLKTLREERRRKIQEEKQQRREQNLKRIAEEQALKAKKEQEILFRKKINYLKKNNVGPVLTQKEEDPLFYGSMNGQIYYLLLNQKKPRFQFIDENGATAITPVQLLPILEQIDLKLNQKGEVNSILEKIGDLYHKFDKNNRIVSQIETIRPIYQQIVNQISRQL